MGEDIAADMRRLQRANLERMEEFYGGAQESAEFLALDQFAVEDEFTAEFRESFDLHIDFLRDRNVMLARHETLWDGLHSRMTNAEYRYDDMRSDEMRMFRGTPGTHGMRLAIDQVRHSLSHFGDAIAVRNGERTAMLWEELERIDRLILFLTRGVVIEFARMMDVVERRDRLEDAQQEGAHGRVLEIVDESERAGVLNPYRAMREEEREHALAAIGEFAVEGEEDERRGGSPPRVATRIDFDASPVRSDGHEDLLVSSASDSDESPLSSPMWSPPSSPERVREALDAAGAAMAAMDDSVDDRSFFEANSQGGRIEPSPLMSFEELREPETVVPAALSRRKAPKRVERRVRAAPLHAAVKDEGDSSEEDRSDVAETLARKRRRQGRGTIVISSSDDEL